MCLYLGGSLLNNKLLHFQRSRSSKWVGWKWSMSNRQSRACQVEIIFDQHSQVNYKKCSLKKKICNFENDILIFPYLFQGRHCRELQSWSLNSFKIVLFIYHKFLKKRQDDPKCAATGTGVIPQSSFEREINTYIYSPKAESKD